MTLLYLRNMVHSSILYTVNRNYKESSYAYSSGKWTKSLLIVLLVICGSSTAFAAQTPPAPTQKTSQSAASASSQSIATPNPPPESTQQATAPQTQATSGNTPHTTNPSSIKQEYSFIAFLKDLSKKDSRVALGLLTLGYTLCALLLVNVLLPAFRHYRNLKSIKLSYLEFLRADIDSVKKRYDDVVPRSEVSAMHPGCHDSKSWLEILTKKDSNAEIPAEIVQIDNLLHRAMQSVSEEPPYYPLITYTTMPSTEISHDHPLWKLKKEHTKVISRYLNSEVEVQETTKSLYSSPMFDWINGDNVEQRKRWIMGAESLLDELANHYIHVKELDELLAKLLNPYRFLFLFRIYWRV
ncbi:MAG: hypothetical protein CBB67_009405 [Alteromonadaceae bacterium TMED7]|nr:MAG: hypothetical protein CBB67_009405 [Alteromonadaceae bacterium TMED7]